MAKIDKAVFDTGPLLHLPAINYAKVLSVVKKRFIPPEVVSELRHYGKTAHATEIVLSDRGKDLAKIMIERYSLDIGEAQAVALAVQEKVQLLFTDDLDARTVAKSFGLEVHGTLGLVTRALRERIITKGEAKSCVISLHKKSSLFLTRDLVLWALKEIDQWKQP